MAKLSRVKNVRRGNEGKGGSEMTQLYVCDVCGETLHGTSAMARHERKHSDKLMVELQKYYGAMQNKLIEKKEEGRKGWDKLTKQQIMDMIKEHCIRHMFVGDESVDIGNLAFFLWYEQNKMPK